jgi:tetratricopeptide (TPR) repeat protein
MFPNRRDLYFERKIHEQMMPSALRLGLVMEEKDVVIEHHGYADPQTLKKKALRNVKLLLEEYNAIGPDSIMAVEIADSYFLIENHDEARKWYQKTIDLPECEKITPAIAAHAHYGLGNIYNSENKFDRALSHLKEALILSPWRADVLYSLAVAEELNGSCDAAVDNLKKILTMSPVAGQVGVDFRAAKIKAALRLVRILVEMNKIDESIHIVDDMLESFPQRPEFHNAAGKVYIKAGRLIDGLHAFEKSLSIIIEGNIEAYIGLSVIFDKAGAKDKAETTLRSAEPIFINDPKYWVFRNYLLSDPLPEGLFENRNCEQQLLQLKKEFFNLF